MPAYQSNSELLTEKETNSPDGDLLAGLTKIMELQSEVDPRLIQRI